MSGKSLDDLFNLLQNCASKDDAKSIITKIDDFTEKTIEKIAEINEKVSSNKQHIDDNAEHIKALQVNVEQARPTQNQCVHFGYSVRADYE